MKLKDKKIELLKPSYTVKAGIATETPISVSKCSADPQSLIPCGFADEPSEGIHLFQNAPLQNSPLFLDKLHIYTKAAKYGTEAQNGVVESEEPLFTLNLLLSMPVNA